jgi:hypothetical protein
LEYYRDVDVYLEGGYFVWEEQYGVEYSLDGSESSLSAIITFRHTRTESMEKADVILGDPKMLQPARIPTESNIYYDQGYLSFGASTIQPKPPAGYWNWSQFF